MKFSQLMAKLQEFELALRDLYRWLADEFKHDREVSETFARLSLQEQAHANLVAYQRKLAAQYSTAFAPVVADVVEVDRLLEQVGAFRRRPGAPDLGEALALAKMLESSAAENLHRSAIAESNAAMASFVDRLAGDDARHLDVLERLEVSKRRVLAA